jgi:hypothetical protein
MDSFNKRPGGHWSRRPVVIHRRAWMDAQRLLQPAVCERPRAGGLTSTYLNPQGNDVGAANQAFLVFPLLAGR